MLVFDSQVCGPCSLFVVSVMRLTDDSDWIGLEATVMLIKGCKYMICVFR